MKIEKIKTRIEILEILTEVFNKADVTDAMDSKQTLTALETATSDLLGWTRADLAEEEKREAHKAKIKPEF